MEIHESRAGSRAPGARTRGARIFRAFSPSTVTLATPRRGEGGRSPSGFTLAELLVVISILGLMAGLAVPVLKNFGKSDATLGASRQLLDGVARARQLAISQHTTVYMVFVGPNFWTNSVNNTWWGGNLTPAQLTAVTNLADRQLTGYTFVSLRSMGDQPGQGRTNYLAPWQSLPDNTFIAWTKFTNTLPPIGPAYTITDSLNPGKSYNIYGFATIAIPFPTTTNATLIFPCVEFNYLGQLTDDGGQTIASQDEYIPLAKGIVVPQIDPATKALILTVPPSPGSPQISETPPGNSVNSYNIVHIDRLTGRAVLEYQKIQ